MEKEQDYFDYAINPYALGEAVAGEVIEWNSINNPQKKLAEILNVPENALFAFGSPFITPNIQIQKDGSVKYLDKAETNKRILKFVADNTQKRIASKPPVKGLRLTSVRKRIPEIMLADAKTAEALKTDSPWMPANFVWADTGNFFEDVAEVTDPRQGSLGDCYFIAALASVAWSRPYAVVNAAKPSFSGDKDSPLHTVTFYRNGKAEEIEVSERIPLYVTTDNVVYAYSADATEIWPAVMEKAYAKWKTGTGTDFPNYQRIVGGSPADACAELIGGKATYKWHADISEKNLIDFIKSNCESYYAVNPMVASTHHEIPKDCDYQKASLAPSHSYSILGYEKYQNEYYIILRNPWGYHHGTLDTRNGKWNVYRKSIPERIWLNQNGIFSMKLSTFKKYFRRTGVAK